MKIWDSVYTRKIRYIRPGCDLGLTFFYMLEYMVNFSAIQFFIRTRLSVPSQCYSDGTGIKTIEQNIYQEFQSFKFNKFEHLIVHQVGLVHEHHDVFHSDLKLQGTVGIWGEIHQCHNSTILVSDWQFANEKLC